MLTPWFSEVLTRKGIKRAIEKIATILDQSCPWCCAVIVVGFIFYCVVSGLISSLTVEKSADYVSIFKHLFLSKWHCNAPMQQLTAYVASFANYCFILEWNARFTSMLLRVIVYSFTLQVFLLKCL